jgi:hypothetical protein
MNGGVAMCKKSSQNLQLRNNTAEFLILSYRTGGDGVDVRVQNSTLWVSQKQMGLLFDTSSDNVGLHLKNIFREEELSADSVTEEFSVTAADSNVRTIAFRRNYHPRPYFYPSFLRKQEFMKPLGNLKGWIPACAGMTGYGKDTASCSC